MRKAIISLLMAVAIVCTAIAELPITKVDKIAPTEEIFMDMAVSAAKKAKQSKGLPCGAVIILNNAFRSAGTADATATAEQNAIAKAALPSLENAIIFTVNEPTTEAYNDICRFGAESVVFVNGRDDVVAAGIYPASAYDDSKIDTTLTQVPLKQISFAEAASLLK